MTTPSDPAREHANDQHGGSPETVVQDGRAGARAAPAPGPDSTLDAEPSVAELQDRWLRAVAELDNVRKRFERQLAEQVRAERARTAALFLPVLDNLELALRHASADPAAIVAGVQAVHAQALDVLTALGYQRVEPAGERFDPARHEAAQVVPAGDGTEPGTVTAVLRPGYADTNGVLLRPAVVMVAQSLQQQQQQSQ